MTVQEQIRIVAGYMGFTEGHFISGDTPLDLRYERSLDALVGVYCKVFRDFDNYVDTHRTEQYADKIAKIAYMEGHIRSAVCTMDAGQLFQALYEAIQLLTKYKTDNDGTSH